jgi:hypothetical protein
MLKDTRPGIAVVTRKTRMAGMLERWATKGAARFRLVQAKLIERARAGDDFDQDDALAEAEEEFDELAEEEDVYQQVVKRLHSELDFGLPVQFVDRGFLPNFDFGRFEAVVVVGQDGLVANAAKYVGDVPIVAVNPDPARIDGILLPFQTAQARAAVSSVLKGTARTRSVTLAEAHLQDGQKLLAFNDFFIGCNSHVSARNLNRPAACSSLPGPVQPAGSRRCSIWREESRNGSASLRSRNRCFNGKTVRSSGQCANRLSAGPRRRNSSSERSTKGRTSSSSR